MQTDNIIKLTVYVAIGVLVFTSLLLPVVNDVNDIEDDFNNNGFFYATELNENSADTLAWDHTNPTILTVNGVDIDTSEMESSYANISLGFSDKWFLRFALGTTIIYLYDVDTALSSSTDYASPTNEKDFSLECNNGIATIVIGEVTYTETISGDGLIISEKPASYVMKKSDTNAYVLGDSAVYCVGRTDRALGVQGTSYNAVFKANVDGGVTPIAYSPNTYTVSDSSVTYSAGPSGYNDLYLLSNCKLDLTDGTNTGTITYNQIFVPATVTAEKAVHADEPTRNVIEIMPILLIAGLLLGIVAYAVRARLS